MRRWLRLSLLLLLLAALVWLWLGDPARRRAAFRAPAEPTVGEPDAAATPALDRPSTRVPSPEAGAGSERQGGAGRPARTAEPGLVEAARRLMAPRARRDACGPYELHTDVGEGPVLDLCRRIGSQLDGVYRARYGLEPVGQPTEAVLLFSSAAAFRRFASDAAGLRVGYAGFSDAARGFVALHVEGEPLAETASTLAHELTHLVHRRSLGPGLAPWLSEGLADGIGDAATPAGLGPLEGRRGAEALARRLAGGYELGRTRPLRELAALSRAEFDRGAVSLDYEQSGLLVRYLLADAELAPRFRRFLRRLERGDRYRPELLRGVLEVSWEDLDRDLERWARAERADERLSRSPS